MTANLNNLLTAFAEEAIQSEPAQSTMSSSISSIVIMVVMVVVFYFLLIRPQRKKDKAVKNMLDSLKVGDRICTIGGIYGTIMDIKDDTITLAVGRDNLSMVVARWSIRSVEDVTIENESEALN